MNQDTIVKLEWKEQRVLLTKQVAKYYETTENQIRNNFNNNKDKFTEGVHYFKLNSKEIKEFILQNNIYDLFISLKARSLILWTFEGSLLLLTSLYKSSRKYSKILKNIKTYYEIPNDKIIFISKNRKEIEFRDIIIKTFEGICDFIPQYNIGKYRIDLYCPTYKLAIEFDEKYHEHNIIEDIQRQKYIESKLGCTFIRVKENEPIEKAINKIIIHILNTLPYTLVNYGYQK